MLGGEGRSQNLCAPVDGYISTNRPVSYVDDLRLKRNPMLPPKRKVRRCLGCCFWALRLETTLQGTITYPTLGKGKVGDMLVPRRVDVRSTGSPREFWGNPFNQKTKHMGSTVQLTRHMHKKPRTTIKSNTHHASSHI